MQMHSRATVGLAFTKENVMTEKLFTYEQVEKMLEAAVLEGFSQSCEGYNAEWPFGDEERDVKVTDVVGELFAHNMIRKELKRMDNLLLQQEAIKNKEAFKKKHGLEIH
jgi:hypothetical protein